MIQKSFDHLDELDIFMNDHKFIIIQVSADWCKPCKTITPLVNEYIQKLECDKTFLFLKCDFDTMNECESFMETYHIQKIPHFIFIEYGVMTKSYTGANMDILQKEISDFVRKNQPISKEAFESTDF